MKSPENTLRLNGYTKTTVSINRNIYEKVIGFGFSENYIRLILGVIRITHNVNGFCKTASIASLSKQFGFNVSEIVEILLAQNVLFSYGKFKIRAVRLNEDIAAWKAINPKKNTIAK